MNSKRLQRMSQLTVSHSQKRVLSRAFSMWSTAAHQARRAAARGGAVSAALRMAKLSRHLLAWHYIARNRNICRTAARRIYARSVLTRLYTAFAVWTSVYNIQVCNALYNNHFLM